MTESGDGPEVPATAVRGRRTPTFSLDTVPAALTNAHVTATWAELVVLGGSVVFVDESPRRIVAAPGSRVPIIPGVRHHVEPDTSAEFYVQFYERS
ncbi:DUF1971 domain-containing protein [Candidatus Poriferisodalis sp.]|uniref:DUF1971 domain-containing protein n=1 Tax=Candidatus Poriferisodalis sp. TaxID=3101277 RepID=UPI003D0B004C